MGWYSVAKATFYPASQFELNSDRVAVVLQPGRFGCHIGLAYHGLGERPSLLHFRWHKQICTEPFPRPAGKQIVSQCALPRLCAKHVVAILRCISSTDPKIAYGFDITTRHMFDRHGAYLRAKARGGLTCATFVVEVFRAISIRILDEKSWPSRTEDIAWRDNVCQLLSRSESIDVVKKVGHSFTGKRLRPEEVAYAAAFCSAPAMHSRHARLGGAEIAAHLNKQSLHGLAAPLSLPFPVDTRGDNGLP